MQIVPSAWIVKSHFLEKNEKKNISNYHLLKFLPITQSAKADINEAILSREQMEVSS